ncbi:hypothetical protein GCM10011403_15320 [Pseudohongiella nitratireducens]|uniref:Uncharacterized protein n=1 Tax=Pseudohongiella nitratireducens TaxID=1768907 RepID=A0A917LUW2_9GAMM|nr:FlhC family transcriptional regulator [Pseudohongiella nitratireducens]GGG58871.1 hypothetical protein GCM10011403_15320 [Pseudohongiella nitratireducens]
MNTRNNPLHLWVHAREMALMGYVTRIIILETGLTDKQVRRIYRDLEDDGMDVSKNRASNAIKSGASLVTNQLSKLHASLLMGFYRQIGGRPVESSTCIAALNRAYRMYRAAIAEIAPVSSPMGKEAFQMFTISDAWCLASEMRSGDAMFEHCCDCGCEFWVTGISG